MKTLVGWLLVVFGGLAMLAALVVAGQYAGAKLFVQLQDLPASIVGVWTLLDYWEAYGHVGRVRLALLPASFVAALIPVLPLVVVALSFAIKRPKRELHGSARFAKRNEIRKAGLLDEAEGRVKKGRRHYPSIIVGRLPSGKPGRPDYSPRYLTFIGQQFVMLAAPTRSGKGVAVVIPNLLTYPDSIIVLDIKGENYDITSQYRKNCGQAVYRWAPFDETGFTHAWNPLVKIGMLPPHIRIGRLQMIAARLYHSPDARNKFFYDSAADLFLGVALYLMETRKEDAWTFGEILRAGVPIRPDVTLRAHVIDMMERDRDGEPLSGDCLGALARLLSAPDETLGNISKTFMAGLTLFANPIVDAATSRCDFDVADVRREPMSIYLVLPAGKLSIAALLSNLFFTQWIEDNLDELPEANPDLKYQCLGILDEAPAVGKIEILDKASAFIAGYNIRLLTILQSKSQGEDPNAYGVHGMRTLVVNHALKVVYPPRDINDSKEMSETLGYLTEKSTSTSRTRGRSSSSGENTSDQKRNLMYAQELEVMPQAEEIILGMGLPIQCEKAFYYEDRLFIDRLRSVCSLLGEVGDKKLPTEVELTEARVSGQLRYQGIEIIKIAEIHAERSARIAAAVRASRQAGASPITAKERLALDQAVPSGFSLQKVREQMLDSLFAIGEPIDDDLRRMFADAIAGNTGIALGMGLVEPDSTVSEAPAGHAADSGRQGNVTEHAPAGAPTTTEAYHHE
ncbi:type IV secretory system conjugative DNA transfer family protein (plasmid) [Burkholderia aenigmatica]|uniref:type IV secretory system conjugative DNA transfer family protein n=1 Tax=Burkholderia aenigmatica TaxID=2015348 RepID=UPI001F1C2773|nr:type IV secretory system conjugative DNA transfer family protein [Burkholderia aenigmatica]UKD18113.1 type IV secretory system conjugative DNA transfer family protein [Burkholderia aenigmatica]